MAEKKVSKKEEPGAWKILPSILSNVYGTVENFALHLLDSAEETAQELLRRGIEKLISFFLVAVGTLFLAVGVAAFLSDYFHVAGAGPLIVGGAFLVMGLFFVLSRK